MCCLFGFIDYNNKLSLKQKNTLLSVLSKECEVRGTDATGIAYNDGTDLRIIKKALPARKAKLYVKDGARIVMGHTRFTTQGTEKDNYNNHPFPGVTANANFALAHNGVLRNDELLRITEDLPQTKIKTDSFIAVQLIEKQHILDFEALQYMAEKVSGSFCFTVLDDMDNLYFVKGDNPMTIYDFPKLGLIIYASTPEILNKALKKLKLHKSNHKEIKIKEGEILRIDAKGEFEKATFEFEDYFYSPLFGLYSGYRPYALDFVPENKYEDVAYCDYEYINELKSVASYFGWSPADIDCWIDNGLTPDDIEDIMYSGYQVADG